MSCGVKKAPIVPPCRGSWICFVCLCVAGAAPDPSAVPGYGDGQRAVWKRRALLSPHTLWSCCSTILTLSLGPRAFSLGGTQLTLSGAPGAAPGLPAPSPAPRDPQAPRGWWAQIYLFIFPSKFFIHFLHLDLSGEHWWTGESLHLQEYLCLFCSFCKKYFDRFC